MLRQSTDWEFKTDSNLTLRGKYIPGPASESPLIHFIHGGGFSCHCYQQFLTILNRNFALFLHDAQGHGKSDTGTRYIGWKKTADRAVSAFRANRALWQSSKPPRNVIAMGHSFGAVISLYMAESNPQLFNRVVALDPILFSKPVTTALTLADKFKLTYHYPLARKARSRKQNWESKEHAAQELRNYPSQRGWSDDAFQAYLQRGLTQQDDGSVSLTCPPWMEAAIFSTMPEKIWRITKKIQTPVHALVGIRSFPHVEQGVIAAQTVNKNFSLDFVPGRHCFMLENPAVLENHHILKQCLQPVSDDRNSVQPQPITIAAPA